MRNQVFEEIVGQSSVVSTLSLYIDAFKQTERLPILSLNSGKGGGKTHLARAFRSGLRRKDGSKVPLLEINFASVKNSRMFFEQIVPTWTENRAILFGDEFHNCPKDLQQIFLSLFNVDRSPIREIVHEGIPYTFDFTQISFIAATTNHEKLAEPLRDRLRSISLEEYTPDQLFEIFLNNLENRVNIESSAKAAIISTFRGNPRDAVVKAEDLKTYISAQSNKNICEVTWENFCRVMGVKPLGLSASEMQLIKVLGKHGDCSLNMLSSITGFERSAIQNDYEKLLFRKGLLVIDSKRKLTADGVRFYHNYCK